MRRFLLSFTVVLATLLALPSFASAKAPWAKGGPSRAEDLEVSLLTFSVGDDIASWFGHTALMVRDERLGEERIYNYGMFSFGPDMLPKFLMGRLEFWVGEAHAQRTISFYKSLDRDVLKSPLNLSPEKTKEVAEFLAWNVEPENRDYLYDHYADNCATRIRDIISEATDGQFEEATSDPARLTLRGHTNRHTRRNFYIDVLLSAWMNDQIDEPIRQWDEMFLPGELLKQFEAFEYEDAAGETVPLVKKTEVIYRSERPPVPDDPATLWPWTLLIGLLLGGAGWYFAVRYQTTNRAKWRRLLGLQHLLAGLLFGIPGLVAALYHFTDHSITHLNENLLLWNPLTFLTLLLWIPVFRGRPWALRMMRWAFYLLAATSLLMLPLKLLPMFDQSNGFVIAMLLPFNLLMAAAMHRFGPPPERGELTEVTDGIWNVGMTHRFMELAVGSQMTVVRLDDGSLWLHSPIAIDDALKAQVDELGEVKYLVGPNRFHHSYLGDWKQAYPEAMLCGAPGLSGKRDDLTFDMTLGTDSPWGEEIESKQMRGAPALSEIVFFHRATKTLICADTAQNFRTSDHLPTKIFLKVNGLENQRALSPLVKVTFTNKAEARASVDEILEWDFDRITVCHGSTIEGDAREKFRRLYDFLD